MYVSGDHTLIIYGGCIIGIQVVLLIVDLTLKDIIAAAEAAAVAAAAAAAAASVSSPRFNMSDRALTALAAYVQHAIGNTQIHSLLGVVYTQLVHSSLIDLVHVHLAYCANVCALVATLCVHVT
jgi:hypothetical protein